MITEELQLHGHVFGDICMNQWCCFDNVSDALAFRNPLLTGGSHKLTSRTIIPSGPNVTMESVDHWYVTESSTWNVTDNQTLVETTTAAHHDSGSSHNVSKVAGITVFLGVFILLIIGICFIITRIRKKKCSRNVDPPDNDPSSSTVRDETPVAAGYTINTDEVLYVNVEAIKTTKPVNVVKPKPAVKPYVPTPNQEVAYCNVPIGKKHGAAPRNTARKDTSSQAKGQTTEGNAYECLQPVKEHAEVSNTRTYQDLNPGFGPDSASARDPEDMYEEYNTDNFLYENV